MSTWKADDGSLINYEIYGSLFGKESVLLLHGLLGSISSQWRGFIDPLASKYRVLLVDLRGHGRSENADTTLNPDRVRRDIEGLLDYLEVEWLHVAGYDFGGYLGLMLHLNQSERVKSLIMHATKFYWPEHTMNRMRKNLDPDYLSAKVPGYANQLVVEHGANRWRSLVRQSADLVTYISMSGITENMATLSKCPTLVSVGDRDEMIPVAEALRLSRVIKRGALLVLPGVSHSFHAATAQALIPSMQSFLTSTGSSWSERNI
ncbi:MAG: alpha/beta hydrolase [Candidatus Promineifilaceae bacterium]